jgi:V-type H+-transporting ATPase proteolipid subunit
MGCVCAIVFTCFGAAYGTAKAGVGVCSMGVLRPDLIVKSKLHQNVKSFADAV